MSAATFDQGRAAAYRPLGTGSGPTLLVASTGGHLEQLVRWRDRLSPSLGPTEWSTFDGPQARALLRGERVHHVGYIAPRDYAAAAMDLPEAVRILRRTRYRAVVSTGAGIAMPFFLAARTLGVPCYYIESAARSAGPSLTGRLVSRIPGTRLFTQYESWADDRWAYAGSLFDVFEPAGPRRRDGATASPGRVVITLGTMRRYDFRRAVERLTRLLPEVVAPDAEVLWQVGGTDVTGLGITARNEVPGDELRRAIHEADLVVAHGGIGSALTALDAGHLPVLLPRRRDFGEHVDDHQVMICERLDRQGVALGREVSALTVDDLWHSAHARTRTVRGVTTTLDRPRAVRRSALAGRIGR